MIHANNKARGAMSTARTKSKKIANMIIEAYKTKKDVADLLGVSVRTVDNLIAREEIPFYKLSKSIRFKLSEVAAAMEEKKVRPWFHN